MAMLSFLTLSWAIFMAFICSVIILLLLRWFLRVTIDSLLYTLPPGPYGIPLLGCLAKVDNDIPLHTILTDMAGTYGDIFSMRLGDQLTFIISSREAMKKSLQIQSIKFSGRPRFLTFKETKGGFDKGLSLRNFGNEYVENKNLVHLGFRNLFRRQGKLSTVLKEECRKFVAYLNNLCFIPLDPQLIFRKAVASTFLRLTFGDNYDYDDKELIDFVNVMQEWFEIAETNNPADFIALLKYLPNERLKKAKRITEHFDRYCSQRLLQSINGKRESHGFFSSSFVDKLTSVSNCVESTGSNLLQDEAIQILVSRYGSVLTDMIGGSFDTVPTTLSWMILYLNENADARKILEEEVRVNHQSEVEEFLSNEKSPYLSASVYEAIRNSTVAPLGLPHSTIEDVKIDGFDIPKNSLVLINLWAINHCPSQWQDPDMFDPSRYLIDKTMVDIEATRRVCSFSTGVRKCPGEKLAIVKLKALMGTFIKHFNFEIFQAPSDRKPQKGLTSKPKSYKVILRKCVGSS